MARSILVLILMMTQLLIGSGGSLYLCVSSDGSCWCIENDPETCTCCPVAGPHEVGQCSCESDVCSRCSEYSEAPESAQNDFKVANPCGCTHILISSEQVASSAQISTISGRYLQVVALVPCILACDELARCSQSQASWNGPPQIPAFALSVLSTVVLRC